MSLSDLEEVWEIERLVFTTSWPLSHFYSELKNPVSHTYIAKIIYPSGESVLTGYVIFWMVAFEADFLNLAIHPLYRCQGIGSRLLKYALETCKKGKTRKAFLEVRKSNVPARRLYERAGFRTIGVRRGYYSDNKEDAIMMSLKM
ncbi:MAG: ribosomal protein S18-alanine N-acetyltransferase [Thermodesulfobacteriota bacterium]